MQHQQILSVTDRLNLNEELVAHIQEVILFGWYQAYAMAPSPDQVNKQSIINEIFTQFSGNALAGALYIFGKSEPETNDQDIRRVITELFLAAIAIFDTIHVTYDQFLKAAHKVQELHSLDIVGGL